MKTLIACSTALWMFSTGVDAMGQTTATQTNGNVSTPTRAWNPSEHFRLRCEQIENAIERAPSDTTCCIVLLGDSITEGIKTNELAGMSVINQGISGDQVENATSRTGVRNRLHLVPKAKPAIVCVMIGINDFWGGKKDAATVEQSYRGMATDLRATVPKARIIIESTLPAGGPHKHLQQSVDELNRKLPQIASTIKAEFLLLDPIMKSSDGELRPEFTTDGIHLSPAGYAAWLKRLEQYIGTKPQ
ncbi:MAG: GDSL-type esterase/lipase family protein [Candidatus Sumerlaeaceae bacterium]